MVDPLSYFLLQPVFHDWFNKGCGMCYPVCGIVHIKEPLLLIRSSPCVGSGFLSRYLNVSLPYIPTPYNRSSCRLDGGPIVTGPSLNNR